MADTNEEKNYINGIGESLKCERKQLLLIILAFFCGLSLLLFSLLLYFVISRSSNLCLTRDCTLTAATLVSAMDPTVDPCEDFYKFTCANFIRKNPVPEHKDDLTTFLQYEDTLNLQLKNLIEDHNPYGDPDIVIRMVETYHLCLNTSEDADKEFAALKSFIEDVFDGFPMLNGSKWKTKYARLDDFFLNMLKNQINIPFTMVYIRESNDETVPVIHFRRVSSFLQFTLLEGSSEIQEDDDESEVDEEKKLKRRKNTIEFLMSTIKAFGGKTTESEMANEVHQILDFVDFTEKIYQESINDTNSTYMTIKELTDYLDNRIDWLKIINAVESNKKFTNYSKVEVNDLLAMKRIPEILDKHPRRVIVNSITWEMLPFLMWLSRIPGLKEISEKFITEMYPYFPFAHKSDWEVCIFFIQQSYPLILTRLFVNKFVDRNGKIIADEMIQMIQEAYRERIKKSNWLDDQTKHRAVKKANAIRRFVAYPDFIFDNEKVEKAFAHLPKINSTWWETMHNLEMHPSSRKTPAIEELDNWDFNPLVINAFYMPSKNSITFPSGILQLPFFDENRLAAVNFGMIGSIIGHEIGHAFDDYGSHYNETGGEEMWWTNKTAEIFEKKTQCFIDQYNQYCPEDLQGGKDDEKICVDGEWTLGENLADTTGLKAALDAYRIWVNKYGQEPRLPGLEMYSPEQVFFISYSYMWCQNLAPDKWLDRYKYDSHSPGNYRVQGTLSNSLEFRKAFNCLNGLYNRHEQSCVVW